MPPLLHPSASGAPLHLAPLYRHCLFSSQEPQDSHHRVAQEFSDHRIKWGHGAVDTVMYRAHGQSLSVSMLRYGPEVEINPQPFEDFALIHITLQGAAEMISDGQRITLMPGRTALLSPRHNLHMRWTEDSEQLILKIPGYLLRNCSSLDNPLEHLPSVALLPGATQTQWSSLLQTLLLATCEAHSDTQPSSWLEHLERGVACYLLQHTLPDNVRHRPVAAPAPAAQPAPEKRAEKNACADMHRLQAMERYMHARLGAPLALEDLARAAGVSTRSLHSLCLRHYGCPPMEYLRTLRLQAVRKHLLQESGCSVTDVALQYGFGHLGRFSAYYREQFGELPSETVRGALTLC